MRIPVIHGVIDRRILLNYRIDPDVMARQLPAPFRPRIVGGFGIMGICLIRLKELRPRFWPARLGLSSENAALRAAVEWDQDGQTRQGVYIRRRETNLRLNAWAGGRIFPGTHSLAKFDIHETEDRFAIDIKSNDGQMDLSLRAVLAADISKNSALGSLRAASRFFEEGSVGYSDTSKSGRFDGMELKCVDWQVEPLEIEQAQASYFDDQSNFPQGTISPDCALLMRGVVHTWESLDDLCCEVAPRFELAAQGEG